jgi:hypothetical protein
MLKRENDVMAPPDMCQTPFEHETLMPIDYVRDDRRRRIRLLARDPITVEDGFAVLARQVADGAWHYGMLVDVRLATLQIGDNPAFLARVQELEVDHGPHGPVAVVTRKPANIAAAKGYAMQSAPTASLEVDVFWDMDDAERWLDGYDIRQRPPAR